MKKKNNLKFTGMTMEHYTTITSVTICHMIILSCCNINPIIPQSNNPGENLVTVSYIILVKNTFGATRCKKKTCITNMLCLVFHHLQHFIQSLKHRPLPFLCQTSYSVTPITIRVRAWSEQGCLTRDDMSLFLRFYYLLIIRNI